MVVSDTARSGDGVDLSADLAAVLARQAAAPPPDLDGRGILVCAGGVAIFTNAYVLVRALRDTLGCRLPIEVWHMGPEEMSPAMAALLGEHGVRVVDAGGLIAAEGGLVRDGWQLKAFALHHCRFAEVLLLDADQVPVADPAAVFDWPLYQESGALFWPDVVEIRAENPVWKLVGLPASRSVSIESGQMVIDKRRHAAALAVSLRLNERSDLLYSLIYGDKDTFLIGWMIAGAPFSVMPHRPFVDDRVLFQCGPDGQVFFQHRTNAKWALGDQQIAIENFQHSEACQRYIDELQRRWNGRIFLAPPRSMEARAIESSLAGRAYSLRLVGDRTLVLDLFPHGEIGRGQSPRFRNWYVTDGDEETGGGLQLVIDGDRGVVCRLGREEDDAWSGSFVPDPAGVQGRRIELQALSTDVLVSASSLGLLPAFLQASGFPSVRDEDLLVVLHALEGVEPGVAQRLERLAAQEPGASALRDRLAALAARMTADRPGHRDVVKGNSVLRAGYVRL